MSDFLGRMAARAVGAAPLAQPRPASPFAGEAAHGGLEEVVEEVVAARPAAPVRASAQRNHEAAHAEAPRPASVTDERAAKTLPDDRPAAPTAHPRVVAESATESRPGKPEAALAEPLRAAVPGTPPSQASDLASEGPATPAPAAPPVPTVTATPAAATRTTLDALPTAPPSRPDTAAPADVAPPVRVHIGRLEVRANLQPEQPRTPRRAAARDDPTLSLSDYLRGAGGKR